jgi:Cof subfamily protein (haloacid dehalogenase superfamily)
MSQKNDRVGNASPESSIIKKIEHLIIVDLDGTLLNRDFSTLNLENKKALQKLQKRGHKICIATGRNYNSAISFYKEIGLKGQLATYNGAYINNPSLETEIPVVIPISRKVLGEILSEEIVKKNLINCMVDTVKRETKTTCDDIYYREIFFNGNPYKKVDINNIEEIIGEDALQLVMEFSNDNKRRIDEIISTLRRNYKNSIAFYYGGKLKAEKEGDTILVPDKERVIVKVRSVNANKGEAAKLIAGYNNISLNHTIAFGNDINDMEMMGRVGVGVAVSNSENNLKAYVHDITEFDSHEGGVAKYLLNFFGPEDDEE